MNYDKGTAKVFLAFVGGLVVGVGIGTVVFGDGIGISETRGREIADRLLEKGYVFDVGFLGGLEGVVTRVNGNQLTVSVSRPSAVDVILGRDDVRTVSVDDADVVRRVDLTPEEAEAERRRLDRALEEGGSVEPPLFFNEVKVTAADIAEGSTILIESDEEIGANNRIAASRIVILPAFSEGPSGSAGVPFP